MIIAKSVKFTGSVQGVGFRFTCQRIAGRYDLVGYVKNMPDGSVEMLAQGDPEEVDFLIEDIQESFASHIRDTKINQIPTDPDYASFEITF